MPKHKLALVLFALVAIALLAAVALSGLEAVPKADDGPQYTESGKLERPGEEYRQWIFLGASLGLGYTNAVAADTVREESDVNRPPEDVGAFHNVYMNPSAYRRYAETGKFPDGTVMILDLYAAKHREPRGIVTKGHFPANRVGFEVAVKNSRRPDGSKTPWAYYSFTNFGGGPLRDTAQAHNDKTCYNCHNEHAEDDHVWTQFYPTLQALKEK